MSAAQLLEQWNNASPLNPLMWHAGVSTAAGASAATGATRTGLLHPLVLDFDAAFAASDANAGTHANGGTVVLPVGAMLVSEFDRLSLAGPTAAVRSGPPADTAASKSIAASGRPNAPNAPALPSSASSPTRSAFAGVARALGARSGGGGANDEDTDDDDGGHDEEDLDMQLLGATAVIAPVDDYDFADEPIGPAGASSVPAAPGSPLTVAAGGGLDVAPGRKASPAAAALAASCLRADETYAMPRSSASEFAPPAAAAESVSDVAALLDMTTQLAAVFPMAALQTALAREFAAAAAAASAAADAQTAHVPQANMGVKLMRSVVSQKKVRFQEDGFDLDLTYITPRIIAMGFPSQGTEALYRNPMDEVERFFQRRHPQHYRVYNLCSERKYDTKSLEGRWRRFPFDDHNPPAPIKLIPSFVMDAAAFLRDDEHNVVAVHCKAGKGRTGLMVSCLLMAVVPSLREPQHALRYFDDMRTADGKGVTIASQRRYVRYYDTMLAKFAGQEAPARPLPLWRIVVWTPILRSRAPFQAIDSLYFTVRENNEEKFDSRNPGGAGLGKVFRTVAASPTVPQAMQVCYVFERSGGGPLCQSFSGDLRFEFYQRSALLGRPEALFHFWLNTALLERPAGETLYKVELDKASKDKKHATYCEELCVQVHFQDDPVSMPPSYAVVKQRAMGRRQSMRAPAPPQRGLGASADASSGDATPAEGEPAPVLMLAAPPAAITAKSADATTTGSPPPATGQPVPQQAPMPESGKSGWRRFFN